MNGISKSNQDALLLLADLPYNINDYADADFYIEDVIPAVGENENMFRNFLTEQFRIKNNPNFPQIYKANLDKFYQKLIEKQQEQVLQKSQINIMNLNSPIVIHQPNMIFNQQKQIILVIEYGVISFESLKDLTFLFINKKTQQPIKVPKNTQRFNLVPLVSIKDELGEWNYDHFNEQMKIYFQVNDNSVLPEEFRFTLTEQNLKVQQSLQKQNINIVSDQLTVKDFLSNIVLEEQKDNKFFDQFDKEVYSQFLLSMKDLIDLEDQDWEKIQIRHIFKKLIRKYINKYKFNTAPKGDNLKLSNAQILAIEHRIRRFFIYQTEPSQLEHIEYINKKALEEGFKDIAESYKGDSLLKQLEIFYEGYTAPLSYSKSISLSRGMLLYGPPGTGKTTLTDTLPSIIGLTPICNPICSAELNRSLVGQTEKVIIDMVNRARYVPYLLCCVSIDEIDGLAPKRDDKQGAGKIDALAVLLSVIGGIKDVPNLIFVSSTNRINSMDDAFKRRMSGQYFVGRPSPKAREAMINKSQGHSLDLQMKKQLIKVTANFSGAALKQLLSYLVIQTYHRKQSQDQRPLDYKDIIQIATETSRQFNIKLGSMCLPDLFYNQNSKSVLNLDFIKNQIENNIVLSLWSTSFTIYYPCSRTIMTEQDQIEDRVELFKIEVPFTEKMDNFQSFFHYIKQSFANDAFKIKIFPIGFGQYQTVDQIFINISQQLGQIQRESQNNPRLSIICVWDDILAGIQDLILQYSQLVPGNLEQFKQQLQQSKLLMFRFLEQQSHKQKIPNIYNIFYCRNQSFQEFYRSSQWKNYRSFNQDEINYTGRILIDLNEEQQCLQFQKSEKHNKYALHNDPIVLDKRATGAYDVIPKLVEFATERNIDFILLMDQDFLLSANAFDQSKIMENISEKMSEFENYDKSLLIIDVDSMCGLTESLSKSNMGISNSYNLSDAKIYTLMLHYAKTKANIFKNKEYWVALVCNKVEMTKILRSDLQWPEDKKQIDQRKIEEAKQEFRRCISCKKPYTEAKNEDNNCSIHPGSIINIVEASYNWKKMSDDEAKKLLIKFHNQKGQLQRQANNPNQKEPPEPRLIHLCCLQEYSPQGGCYQKNHTVKQEDHNQILAQYYNICEENFSKLQMNI